MDQLIECASLGVIQDIPVVITNLQHRNAALTNTNKAFRNTLIIFGLIGLTIGGIVIYKKYKNDDTKGK